MQSKPEIYSERLLEELIRLKKSIDFINLNESVEFKDELIEICKKLSILYNIMDYQIIAITGPQGAGKSTFIKNIYNISDEWLEPNEGRGEKIPLFIIEKDNIDKPYGAALKFILDDNNHISKKIINKTPEEFKKILGGNIDGFEIPILYVPNKIFNREGSCFLLLPGYEFKNDKNKKWQELLRQSLIYSDLTIIVSDETQLANAIQKEIQEDIKKSINSDFIVVISKTENINEEQKTSIINSAKELFHCDEKKILLSGIGEKNYLDNIINEFIKKIKNSEKSNIFEEKKMKNSFLKNDIIEKTEILCINLRNIMPKLEDSKSSISLNKLLEVFDNSYIKSMKKFEKKLDKILNNYRPNVTEEVLNKHVEEYERLGNKFLKFFETPGEKENIIKNNFKIAIERGQEDFNVDIIKELKELILNTLKIKQEDFTKIFDNLKSVNSNQDKNALIVKQDESRDTELINKINELMPKNFFENCIVLFNNDNNKPLEDIDKIDGIKNTIECLPAIIYMLFLFRYKVQMQKSNINEVSNDIANSNFTNSIDDILKNSDKTKNLFAKILSIDAIVDIFTFIDLKIGPLFSAISLGTEVLSLTYLLTKESYKFDSEEREALKIASNNLFANYQYEIKQDIDDIYDDFRDYLFNKIKKFYNIEKNFQRIILAEKIISDTEEILLEIKNSNEFTYAQIN